MTFSFRPAVRESASVLVGLAGSSGSGKTYSALRLATGLAGGKKFALIDTENGRALHYADQFEFDHAQLGPPFRPAAYTEAIQAADAAGYPVIVVDSFSHEHAGEGGLLDWHEEELERMAGSDWKKRDVVKFSAWIVPKGAHKRMVQQLLALKGGAHLILCFRAEEKIEIVRDAEGRIKVQPKRTLTGLDGWVPIAEKSLPYELTASFLLTPDAPGLPRPIKLQEQHRAFFPLDAPISEEAGKALGLWARGGAKTNPAPAPLKDGGDDSGSDEEDAGGVSVGKTGPAQGPRGPSTDEESGDTQTADTGGASIEWADEVDIGETLQLARNVSDVAYKALRTGLAKQREKYDEHVRCDWLATQRKRLTELASAEAETAA